MEKIFLIEDSIVDHKEISESLKRRGYNLMQRVPKELELFKFYIEEPSKINADKMLNFISESKISVLIIDVVLWGHQNGGLKIFDLINNLDTFEKLIKIYVTRLEKTELRFKGLSSFVSKYSTSRQFEAELVATNIDEEIKKLTYSRDHDLAIFDDNL